MDASAQPVMSQSQLLIMMFHPCFITYHLYADDIQLYCSFRPNQLSKLADLNTCLTGIKYSLNANFLQLNTEKTDTLIIGPDSTIPRIKQCLRSVSSSVKSSLCNLGVILDSSLSLDSGQEADLI